MIAESLCNLSGGFSLKQTDSAYLDLVLEPIRVCAKYKPKFGQGAKRDGLTLAEFQTLYQGDPFYSWFGLDNPMMYSAHKIARRFARKLTLY
jgi:hypothetical protein